MEFQSGELNSIYWKTCDIIDLSEIPEAEAILNESENKKIKSFKSESRIRSFLTIRKLKDLDFSSKNILYHPFGKPYFENSPFHIGISHSKSQALWAFSKMNFGCDIEEVNDRILNLKSKFCEKHEIINLGEPDAQNLTKLWSCKEACYKLIGDQKMDWKQDMHCQTWNLNSGLFMVGEGAQKMPIRCHVIQFENRILAFAHHEK